jgi:hypothetical protein
MPTFSKSTKRKQYKRIKSRKGATSQSKQILKLAKSVNSLTEKSYEHFMMRWSRPLTGAEGNPLNFVPSVPFATCIPVPVGCATAVYDQDYGPSWCSNELVANPALDPTTPANNIVYQKDNIFGRSQNSWQTSQIHHLGGYMRFRMQAGSYNEPREYLLALVSRRS